MGKNAAVIRRKSSTGKMVDHSEGMGESFLTSKSLAGLPQRHVKDFFKALMRDDDRCLGGRTLVLASLPSREDDRGGAWF
jgi:hypothetical protein